METICQVHNVSHLDWAKPVATILGHRNAWFPVNSRGRCTTPSCSQIHWNECNAWRTTNLYQEYHMTAEIPITSTNTIKSNQINFKRFNFQGCAASIVVFGVKSKCTPPPASPQGVTHLHFWRLSPGNRRGHGKVHHPPSRWLKPRNMSPCTTSFIEMPLKW